MIFITALVLIFILRLRFLKGKSVAAINRLIIPEDIGLHEFSFFCYCLITWLIAIFTEIPL